MCIRDSFPPVQETPTDVVRVIWQEVFKTLRSKQFDVTLHKLRRMNVVDVAQREYNGFQYGA